MKTFLPFAALLFVTAGLAHAEDVTTVTGAMPLIEHVHFQTSELASDVGVRSLRTRVRQASRRVCAPDAYTNMANYRELTCLRPTVKHALAQVDRVVSRSRSEGLAGAASIVVAAR